MIFHYFVNCFLIAMWTLKSVFKLISDSSYVYLIECSYMFKGGGGGKSSADAACTFTSPFIFPL